MKVYLDSCIVIGLVKDDFREKEKESMLELLSLYKSGQIDLVTSVVAKEEIEKAPEQYKDDQLMMYNLLKDIPSVGYLVLDLSPVSILGVKQHSVLQELRAILKGEKDAEHIYQSARNEIFKFVTVDEKTILKKEQKIKDICGVQVMLPSTIRENLC